MARTIGTVKSISGKAAVKTLNDQLHVLKVGEALHENEMVYALGADSKVTLTLEGGRELTLNGYDEILLDKSVFTALEEGETLDVKALQQALADALNPENMEETAAGQETTGEANAGAEYTDRNDARGNPSSYLTGTEISALDVTLAPNEEGVENAAPVAFDDEGTATEGSNLDEMSNTLVGNVLSNDTDDSLPNPPADLDVVGVVSNDSTNAAQLIDNHYVIIGKYGTLILNAETGEYTYTVHDNNEEVDALNVGKSVSETFGYTISDGDQFATATLTITIEGSNDAPVAREDTASLSEDDLRPFWIWHPALTIYALDNDTDVDSGDIQLVSVSVVGGIQNGVAWIDTNTNTIKYIPNWMGNQSMNEGDIKTVTLNYTISDDMGATSSSTVTITITGENDQAYIIGDDRGYVKEDIGVEYENTQGGHHGHDHGHSQPQGFLHDSGRLFALDVDEGESRFNTNVASHNTLGTLTIDSYGNWEYSVDNSLVQYLGEGDKLYEYFTVQSIDGTDSETIKITITGTNDIAKISGEDDGWVKEDWHVTGSGFLRETGSLSVSDVDQGEAKFSTHVNASPGNIGGQLTIDQYGNWNYAIDNDLVQYLGEGDKAYETFTVRSIDGSDSETIKITIIGVNDQAHICGVSTGDVTEDLNPSYGYLHESGDLDVYDVDQGEAKFSTNVLSNHGNLGTLSIDSNGHWNYSVKNALVQYLGEGDTKTETFTVKSLDGTDSQTISVVITGTNDIATISGGSQGGVTEDSHVVSSKLYESGRLYVSDADQGEAKFSTTVVADSHNIGGQLTIDQNGYWNYSISNNLVQYLSAGEKIYESFTVKSLDGTDSEIIKITITGTNDAPIANADSSSTEVVTHTTTVYYNLNAGNDYTSSGVTISPINGTSVDRSGPTMGVVGPDSSSQMINPEQSHMEKVGKNGWVKVVDAEEEGIRFVFDHNIKNAVIDFGNFNQQDTASWAIYNAANQKIAFGTYTNNGNPNDSILNINSTQEFNRIEIINSDNSDSFTIDQVIATGSSVNSITSGSLLYFTEADLLSNDTDIDHLDTLSIMSVSNTSAHGAIISMDDDGNILYNPNDALDSIDHLTYDTFNYTISDGHGGTSTATVTVALTPSTTSEAYDGQTLLIESGNNIDFSNIAALSSNFSQIDLKNGDVSLINVSPENVDNASEDGTLVINGEAADSIALSGSWSAPVTADGYTTYTATVDSNLITLHVETEIIP